MSAKLVRVIVVKPLYAIAVVWFAIGAAFTAAAVTVEYWSQE